MLYKLKVYNGDYGQNKTMQQMYRFMLKYDWKYWQMPCDPVITVHIL